METKGVIGVWMQECGSVRCSLLTRDAPRVAITAPASGRSPGKG